MDVASAFRQKKEEPARAAIFSYTVDEIFVLDFRLPFGWCSSPRWWGVVPSAMEHAHIHSPPYTAVIVPEARDIAIPVVVIPPSQLIPAAVAHFRTKVT